MPFFSLSIERWICIYIRWDHHFSFAITKIDHHDEKHFKRDREKKEKNYVEFIWYFFLFLASIDFRFFSRLAFFNKWYFSSIKFPHQRITRLYGVACLHLIFFSSAISPLPLSSSSFDFLCIYLDAMKISQPSREMDKVLEREWVYIWADCLLPTKRQPTAILRFFTKARRRCRRQWQGATKTTTTKNYIREKIPRWCRSSNKFVKLSIYNVNEYTKCLNWTLTHTRKKKWAWNITFV